MPHYTYSYQSKITHYQFWMAKSKLHVKATHQQKKKDLVAYTIIVVSDFQNQMLQPDLRDVQTTPKHVSSAWLLK